MDKGKRLEKLIEDKFKNISQFSKETGIPYTTIKSMIERNLSKANIDNVVKIAKRLNVTVEHLTGDESGKIIKLPSFAYNYFPSAISAGLPFEVDGITQTEKISIPDAMMGRWAGNQDIFMARVNGDSMDRVMPDGSLIAIKPTELENLKEGDIVVFSNDHEYSVKHYHKQTDKLIFKPNSHNSDHHEQHYSEDNNIKIHGKVVMWTVTAD